MRIFEDNGITIENIVLPQNEVLLFRDIDKHEIQPIIGNQIVKHAEALLEKNYPVIPASDYLLFSRIGDRGIYEKKFFERRNDLLYFLIAEIYEGKGRFSDKILDLAWLILDESDWVVPAHNFSRENGLPSNIAGQYDNIDLFAASTGATIAIVYHYSEKVVPKFSSTLRKRIYFELNKRIFEPFYNYNMLSWMAYDLPAHIKKMNNWGPWVASNVLLAVVLCEPSMDNREKYIRRLLEIFDNYLDGQSIDGGCDEGSTYWEHAGGSLFDFLETLYDVTSGKIDVFKYDIIKNIGKYISDVNVCDDYFITFADSHPKPSFDFQRIARYGSRSQCDELYNFAVKCKKYVECNYENRDSIVITSHHPYSSIKNIFCSNIIDVDVQTITEKNIFIPSVEVMIQGNEDLFLAAKAGHNLESHSHNDVGNFLVYSDKKPLIIDVGVGTYSQDTFDLRKRYSIWSMQSSYHNLPDFNGVGQKNGGEFTSNNVSFYSNDRSISMNLTKAYPVECGIDYYKRKISYCTDCITVIDEYGFLKDNGDAVFNFMLVDPPKEINGNKIQLSDSRTLYFDADAMVEIETIKLVDRVFVRDWSREEFFRLKIRPKTTKQNRIVFKIK